MIFVEMVQLFWYNYHEFSLGLQDVEPNAEYAIFAEDQYDKETRVSIFSSINPVRLKSGLSPSSNDFDI